MFYSLNLHLFCLNRGKRGGEQQRLAELHLGRPKSLRNRVLTDIKYGSHLYFHQN